MLARSLRSLSKSPIFAPGYRLLRGIYYERVLPTLDARREVLRRSPHQNIYYCCTQRTGSQWFKRVFRDPLVYRYSGLTVHEYREIGLNEAHFEGPLPAGTICTHLYINYPTYLSIPKPQHYKTFFVLRDPRDIAVSWYFALKYSHGPTAKVLELRRQLEGLDLEDGLRFSIDSLAALGLFEAQKSWVLASDDRDHVKVVRYEDMVADSRRFMHELFRYLDIDMPAPAFATLHDRHEFKNITGGRERGTEDTHDHYRKGVAGDWRNYLNGALLAYFLDVTGNLLEVLRYVV
jgi:hypothetical protein